MSLNEALELQKRKGDELDAAVKMEHRARWNWRRLAVGTNAREYARAALRRAKERTRKAELAHAEAKRAVAAARKAERPLRDKAYTEATKLVGVMEQGANNRGRKVEEIINYAGGAVPEPWCVDFVIWCYGHAGSQVVKRGYTRAVRFMESNGVVRTTAPQKGDIVRYTFDHTGLFVKDNGDGTIQTIEGNTGASGAVSDSATGGDGVYVKRRPKSQVRDYLHVPR